MLCCFFMWQSFFLFFCGSPSHSGWFLARISYKIDQTLCNTQVQVMVTIRAGVLAYRCVKKQWEPSVSVLGMSQWGHFLSLVNKFVTTPLGSKIAFQFALALCFNFRWWCTPCSWCPTKTAYWLYILSSLHENIFVNDSTDLLHCTACAV